MNIRDEEEETLAVFSIHFKYFSISSFFLTWKNHGKFCRHKIEPRENINRQKV